MGQALLPCTFLRVSKGILLVKYNLAMKGCVSILVFLFVHNNYRCTLFSIDSKHQYILHTHYVCTIRLNCSMKGEFEINFHVVRKHLTILSNS